MKSIVLVLITLIALLFIKMGGSKNNITFKVIGCILLFPFLFTVIAFIYSMFTA